ncbi:hypothetical protein ACTNEO_00520 [Gracilibacillus sp. HCP3S3_G5_1]|uniref:hypothetical protein n=1 Tax=unclassified Gracilibacillus TaxID=2625209 RepID=UPI003F8BFBFF
MIAAMYKRREKLAVILLSFVLVVIAIFLVFDTPTTADEWVDVSFLLFPSIFLLLIVFISRNKYQKVKGIDIPLSNATIEEIDHFVVKKDATFISQLLVFEKTGAFMGLYKLSSLTWWQYPFVFFNVISFLPIQVHYFSNQGDKIFSFKKRGIAKTVLDVYDSDDNYIGQYEQEDFKSLVKIKGKLLDRHGLPILSVKTNGAYGDFDIRDEQGHRWAYFYNGRFPFEYTTIFKDIDNDIVQVSSDIDREKKILLLAMIGYMFSTRNSR